MSMICLVSASAYYGIDDLQIFMVFCKMHKIDYKIKKKFKLISS
jgi:D-arabinose 1-dehydrogenase-like Zn-dependent alcohol dehydrogenase